MFILSKIEQIIRSICFIIYLLNGCMFLLVEGLFRPLCPLINKLSGNYFSKNYKRGPPIDYIFHLFSAGLFQLFGIKVIDEFKAEPPRDYRDNVIIMFSHASSLDPFLVQATFPIFSHFIAKKSLFKIPLFGIALKNVGQIPIDRSNLKAAISTLQETGDLANREHKTIAISPEGKRRRSPSVGPDQLLPFKKGPFHLSKAVGCDVVPCCIIGAHRLWPPGQIFPSAGTVIIKYLERIPKEYVASKSLEELQAEVSKRMARELEAVPDEVIFNTEDKPYKIFLIFLVVKIIFWISLFRFFSG